MRKIKKVIASFLAATSLLAVNVTTANAEWKQSGNGWWYAENGGYATGWKQINGQWYYFNSNGWMQTGWLKSNGKWYFLNSDGSMAHDTSKGNFHANSSGEWTYK